MIPPIMAPEEEPPDEAPGVVEGEILGDELGGVVATNVGTTAELPLWLLLDVGTLLSLPFVVEEGFLLAELAALELSSFLDVASGFDEDVSFLGAVVFDAAFRKKMIQF